MPSRARPLGAKPVDLRALDRIVPAMGLQPAGDDVGQRALSGAVRTNEAVNMAAPHREVDVAQHPGPVP